MNFDAIIFDLDGTITESGEGIAASAKYALEQMNLPVPSQDVLDSFVGPPLYDSFVNTCKLTDEQAKQASKIYKQRHDVIGWKQARVYMGMHEVIKSLKRSGKYVALASSKPEALCIKTLEYFGLLPFFDKICAPNESNLRSPKSVFVKNALPTKYECACMIGDRHFDMEGAVGAGVVPVGVLYGYGNEQELLESGARIICKDVAELRKLLLGDTPKPRGSFITLEGSDGCGKSTQHKLLKEYLEMCGIEVISTREPGGCPISERIRNVLLDVKSLGMTDECEALLFAAARKQHVNDTILPALNRGCTVICDRFVDSSIAYQGAAHSVRGCSQRLMGRSYFSCTSALH